MRPRKAFRERERARSRSNGNTYLLSQLHPTLPSRALTQTSGSQIPRTQCGEEEMAISARPLLASALLALLLSAASAADSKNNPADQLVALINSNRTASKASTLADNQGLGCIALQYIKAYEGQCNQVGENKKPVESSFVDTFAPNCGVQAATLSKITGRLLACQSNYIPPAQAFDILIDDAKSLQVLHDKNHTEVGAAVSGTSGGGPYFWCVLFSSGKPNTSFKVDGGVPKTVHPGCFSGNNDDCSGAISIGVRAWRLVAALLFAVSCAFTL